MENTRLQKKWKSVKDCYNRERRRLSGGKSGSAANRKTPYIYYHMLSFLNSNNQPTNTHSNVSHPPDEDDIDLENTQLDQGPESETPTATTATAEPYATRVTAKKRKPEDIVGQQLVKILKESADERRRHDTEVGCYEDRSILQLSSDQTKLFKLLVARPVDATYWSHIMRPVAVAPLRPLIDRELRDVTRWRRLGHGPFPLQPSPGSVRADAVAHSSRPHHDATPKMA
ncbi:hypothetical protein J6590_104910 [Homalodisca vitripennis]|nr:hypothetical protein J6590_104910 [Homalodisca vitripennis]